MTVADILAQKGREVATIAAAVPITRAVAELAARKIGALVVVDQDRRVNGIISERDVVRAIGQNGPDILSNAVSSIMTHEVVGCSDSETINEVMSRMTLGRFRHLPVVKDGRLDGIISIGDVVKARIEEVEFEAEEMRAYIATA
ncbi:CBS domain-containing protein [Bauldia litoralis]|uniref:CBS domain-containing protein n=2 Tax=Bauldia litoralis TaxID=665467 RepID=A0A1G6DIC5_9HYPH|nr:CBS domain-containing protein [Bauldia litoralis]SDB44890.1 CBS domain-containing protein [Bauldia litoralis]